MNKTLANKRVLLGITAGIAAYKTPDLVRRLRDQDAEVQIILSKSADQFVTPLSLQAVNGQAVHFHQMSADSESGMGHIDLARWADVILIAPATANTIAKLVVGTADELLTTVWSASDAKLAIAPAMNQQMWSNPANLSNIETLKQRGVVILGPDSGEQACGDVGLGRMLQPEDIAAQLSQCFESTTLQGKSVMITAGPTWEAIDPVRGITNHSSGRMGYALAQAASEAGAKVTLVSGPTSLAHPDRVNTVAVTSAADMHSAVMNSVQQHDIFIAVAAVADYRPVDVADNKIKKNNDTMTIEMVKNPDILADVSALNESRPFCVGFAAETDQVTDYARKKLDKKQLDMIAANHVGGKETGFGTIENAITLLTKDEQIELGRANKYTLAQKLITEIANRVK